MCYKQLEGLQALTKYQGGLHAISSSLNRQQKCTIITISQNMVAKSLGSHKHTLKGASWKLNPIP